MTDPVTKATAGGVSFGIAAGQRAPLVISTDPRAATITAGDMRNQPADSTARWVFEEAARQNGFDPTQVERGSSEDLQVTQTIDRALSTMATMPRASGVASELGQLRAVIHDAARKESALCRLPAVGGGASIAGYDGLGGGVNGGIVFDPKTGRLGASVGGEVGIGVGARGKLVSGSQLNASIGSVNGVSASVGWSANAQAGPIGVGISQELIGTSMKDGAAERTQASASLGGMGASLNANLAVSGGAAIQLYTIECGR